MNRMKICLKVYTLNIDDDLILYELTIEISRIHLYIHLKFLFIFN